MENTGCLKKKLCSRGISNWGNNFRSIFRTKVSIESSIFQLFHDVKFFFLGLILFFVTTNYLSFENRFPGFFNFSIFHVSFSFIHSFSFIFTKTLDQRLLLLDLEQSKENMLWIKTKRELRVPPYEPYPDHKNNFFLNFLFEINWYNPQLAISIKFFYPTHQGTQIKHFLWIWNCKKKLLKSHHFN